MSTEKVDLISKKQQDVNDDIKFDQMVNNEYLITSKKNERIIDKKKFG